MKTNHRDQKCCYQDQDYDLIHAMYQRLCLILHQFVQDELVNSSVTIWFVQEMKQR